MFEVERYGAIASTNEAVKRALDEGAPEGLVVRARQQTGGYGRQGRTWASPEGGLYQSLLLRPVVPPVRLPSLSLAVSLAVRRAAAALVTSDQARRIAIKWPNDVVVVGGHPALAASAGPALPVPRFAKLCGISLEAHGGGVCVGIGVNVEPPAAPEAVGGKNLPAYLAGLGYGFTCERRAAIDAVGDAVLAAFEPLYRTWCACGIEPLLPEYNEHLVLVGRSVAVANQLGDVTCCGTALRADALGRLVVRTEGGAELTVSSGEAHLV